MARGIKGTRENCKVEGCENKAVSQSLCAPHYSRLRRTGDVQADKPFRPTRQAQLCVVKACGRDSFAKSLCIGHYGRLQTKGDVLGDVPLGGIAKVSKIAKARPLAVEDAYPKRNPTIKKICSVATCINFVKARNLCSAHFARLQRFGDVFVDRPLAARVPLVPKPPLPTHCAVEGCKNERTKRDWCNSHYKRLRTYGDPLGWPASRHHNEGTCLVEGCDEHAKTRDWCKLHYGRWQRTGTTEQNPKWQKGNKRYDASGYVLISGMQDHPNARKGRLAEHRLVMTQIIGRPLLDGENVHHRNGVRDCNEPANLELWVTTQPSGQRVGDLLAWAQEIIERYGHMDLDDEVRDSIFGVANETTTKELV